MANNIDQIYTKFLRIGLKKNAAFKEKIRVELSNQFIFAGLACVFIHNIVNLLFLHVWVDFCLTMVWFSVLAPALILNFLKKTSTARIYLAFGGIFAVFSLHLLFGSGLKLESMYITFLVSAALFFEFSLTIKFAILTVIALLSASVLTTHFDPVFAYLINPAGAFTRFIFSVIMISSLIGKLVLENWRYQAVIIDKNKYLKEYNQQLKSFNYIASHDLKEPLRTIVGFSQLVKRNVDQGEEINVEYLDHIINSTKQLNNLVDDLKDFTDSTEKDISKEIVKIDEIVDSIRTTFASRIAAKKVAISCQNLPPILSSRTALTIILRNLIENGVKYNNNEKAIIDITGEISENMATITVQDNGIGMEAKYHQKIFEMFKRLNSDYEKGSGLGLNIAQNLVKRLDGKIYIAHSKLDQGTTFKIKFPTQLVVSSNSSPKIKSIVRPEQSIAC